jgi:2-amino-4-hydroxy-6-hydroxymethyldihydropteridine diphosphokinase
MSFRSRPVAAYISLGSNLGGPKTMLARARQGLAELPGVAVGAASSLYRTEPQGFADQPFFLNQVLRLDCAGASTAEGLLDAMLELENALGRVREGTPRFGPRPIDLDLLLFGNQRMDTERLQLPHPRMLERAFVLVPLAEIAPDLILPQGGAVREALARLPYILDTDIIYQRNTL